MEGTGGINNEKLAEPLRTIVFLAKPLLVQENKQKGRAMWKKVWKIKYKEIRMFNGKNVFKMGKNKG